MGICCGGLVCQGDSPARIFRVRPLVEHYERLAVRLAGRLQLCEILGFCIASSGAVLAAFHFEEWVTLTVALVAILVAVVEFSQLRNHLIAVNLALRDLQKLIVWWDSLSVVRRRTDDAKARAKVVDIAERAVMQVVEAHTTAAARTQTSVVKSLANDAHGDEEEQANLLQQAGMYHR